MTATFDELLLERFLTPIGEARALCRPGEPPLYAAYWDKMLEMLKLAREDEREQCAVLADVMALGAKVGGHEEAAFAIEVLARHIRKGE